MDITFSTGSLTGLSLPTIFDIARRVDADGLELMLTSRLLQQGSARVQEYEREYGVPIRSLHSVMRLSKPSPEQAAEDFIESAQFARDLRSCAAIVLHTPETHAMHTAASRAWLNAIETVQDMTAGTPVRIAVENSGRLTSSDPTCYFDHPDRLRWLAEEWGVSVTLDTTHAASRQWDLAACTQRLLPHLVNVHLSDFGARSFRLGLANAFLRDHQIPGTGSLPLDDVVQRLAAAGYPGIVTLELSPVALRVPWRPTVERLLRESIAYCRLAAATAPRRARQGRHQHRP